MSAFQPLQTFADHSAGERQRGPIASGPTTRRFLVANLEPHPAIFWLWYLPFNLAINGSLLALIFVRSRTANIVLLALLIVLMSILYWSNGALGPAIARAFCY